MRLRFLQLPLLVLLSIRIPLGAVDFSPQITDYAAKPAGELKPESWFGPLGKERRYWLRQDTTARQAERTELLYHLVENPDDNDAFFTLSEPFSIRNEHAHKYFSLHEPGVVTEVQGVLVNYYELFKKRRRCAWGELPIRREFVEGLRRLMESGMSRRLEGYEVRQNLLRRLEEDEKLTPEEIAVLRTALDTWCGTETPQLVFSALARSYLAGFRGGKPISLHPETEYAMSFYSNYFTPFIQAEKGLRRMVSPFIAQDSNRSLHAFRTIYWQNTQAALAVYPHHPGYRLALLNPDILPEYMQHRGITHYRTLGQDVPNCCLTALSPRLCGTTAEAAEQLREQSQDLAPELQALIPRCHLALGNEHAQWEPVQVDAQRGPSPLWPDASAVQLPMWSPALLGLADAAPATVQQAFDRELEELTRLFDGVTDNEGAGQLLAGALYECDRVRPGRRDLMTPVYLRIALCFEEDGVTVDFSPEDGSYRIYGTAPETGSPIVDEALYCVPQYLHRATLELAMLEKGGHRAELEASCRKLARLLNRHDLWPLIICQRELRGFSPQALIHLFSYYEGEDDKLLAYGEAMGMRHEMQLARMGHEDELGLNLRRAAIVSRVLPATEQERTAAAEALLEQAQEHAYDGSPTQVTGSILLHLLRHGMSEPVLAWKDCPGRFFMRDFSISGLHLVEALLAKGERTEAEALLRGMMADPQTDTTPACRYAASLLENDAARATRLRHDALLLAILYRSIDEQVFRDYRDYQAAHGSDSALLMKAELLATDGREAGITPAMGLRFAEEDRMREACFVFEYLLTEGLTTATPYGLVPTQADICRYRALADSYRKQMENAPQAATEAATQLPHTTVAEPLAALPARDWKLSNGSSLNGQLVSVHTTPRALHLRLADGSYKLLLLSELAESPAEYLAEWQKANGLVLTTYSAPYLDFISTKYEERSIMCRPVAAEPLLSCHGEFHISLLCEDGSVLPVDSRNLKIKEQRERLLAYARSAVQDSQQPHIVTTPQEAAELADKLKLPVIAIFANCHNREGQQAVARYMKLYPEEAKEWSKKYILFCPTFPVKGGVVPSREDLYPPQVHEDMLRLEQRFCPDTTAENSQLIKALRYSPRFARGVLQAVELRPGSATERYIYISPQVPPHQFFHFTGQYPPYLVPYEN